MSSGFTTNVAYWENISILEVEQAFPLYSSAPDSSKNYYTLTKTIGPNKKFLIVINSSLAVQSVTIKSAINGVGQIEDIGILDIVTGKNYIYAELTDSRECDLIYLSGNTLKSGVVTISIYRVDAFELQDKSINENKLNDNSVSERSIIDGVISNNKLKDNDITLSKIKSSEKSTSVNDSGTTIPMSIVTKSLYDLVGRQILYNGLVDYTSQDYNRVVVSTDGNYGNDIIVEILNLTGAKVVIIALKTDDTYFSDSLEGGVTNNMSFTYHSDIGFKTIRVYYQTTGTPNGQLYVEALFNQAYLTENASENAAKMFLDIHDEIANITFKYRNAFDMTVQMCKQGGLNSNYEPVGGNQLFDFCRWFLTVNFNKYITPNPQMTDIYKINGTDFFGPYRVRAVNNADGDMAENDDFTGGNHQYNNGGGGDTNTSHTARCTDIRFLVDGKFLDTYKGYASKLEIRWTNYVQANNTKKADGTGREVLKEEYRVVFDGEKFFVENIITALEEIYIYTYYGMQENLKCVDPDTGNYPSMNNMVYLGSRNNRGIFNPTSTTFCGDKNCRDILAWRNTTDMQEMYMSSDGLGDFYYAKSNPKSTNYGDEIVSAFGSGAKAYFNLVDAFTNNVVDMDKVLPLNANDCVYYRGWYKFSAKTNG